MYKIKNMYMNKYVNGDLCIKDMLADQELLKVNDVKYKTTYDIKEELKKYNFKFNDNKREWVLTNISENEGDIILKDLRNKHLVEKDTLEIRHKKECMICGSYYYSICDCERYMK